MPHENLAGEDVVDISFLGRRNAHHDTVQLRWHGIIQAVFDEYGHHKVLYELAASDRVVVLRR